jgi:hypothetical protein
MSTKYIALMTIQKTVEPGQAKTLTSPGKRPVVKEIAAGTIMTFGNSKEEQDDLKTLLGMTAVRTYTKEDDKGIPETLTGLSPEQQQMAAADLADLARLRADEAARIAAANNGGGNGGGPDTNEQINPVDGLKTHAELDKYLGDKGYTIEGWGAEGINTVVEKQGALKVADQNAAAAAAAASSDLV